jgi:hypothetical protein
MVVLGAALACSGPDTSPAAFCAEVGRVPVVTSADQLQGKGGQATLSDLQSALRRLRSHSPKDVRADVLTLADVTGRLKQALQRQAEGDAAARDKLTADLNAQLAAFQAASQRIVAYTKQTCGIDLGNRP